MTHLPKDFIQSVKEQFDEVTSQNLLNTIQDQRSPASIRLNPQKMEHLSANLENIPWCNNGYYLKERPVFTRDPFFHAGGYYVQEASSMVLEQVFTQCRPEGPVRILDLCAAPGGKSTHLLSLMNENDLLVANEVIRSRASVLQENITKWGSDNALVTNDDPQHFADLEGFFDIMVVDAPCSGEGMFRKDPDAISEWTEANVSLCYERQQRILSDAWDSLACDGVLIYSTCTFNRTENEKVLEWMINNFNLKPVTLSFPEEYNLIPYEFQRFAGYKLLPGMVKGEGYCFFVVRKSEGPDRWETAPAKKKKKKKKGPEPKKHTIAGIRNTDQGTIFDWDNKLVASRFEKEVGHLKQHLNILKSGVFIGETKKNKFIPSHELALSNLIDEKEWPTIELTYDQALNYLMKEPFALTAAERGFNLLTFRGARLGFINHLGNRFNNLYPNSWRILRDFRNEEPFTILLL